MSTCRGRAGLTLIELLTVVVIFSLLLGFSVLFLKNANRDLGVNASANTVQSLLRGAHQVARSNSAPAWVVLQMPQNLVYVLAKETVGEWHLEDSAPGGAGQGAFGKTATINDGLSVPGRVGAGIRLKAQGTIQCGAIPVYSPEQGVAVELWFQRKTLRSRGTLFTIGEGVKATVEADGQVRAQVGSLSIASAGRVPPDAWVYLQLIYSGRDLRLILNRVPAAPAVLGKGSWSPGGAFVVGDSREGFTGIVDEIRLSVIVPRDAVTLSNECVLALPAGVTVPSDGEVVICFDGEGRLDPAVHTAPFEFSLKSPAAERKIVVGLSGTLQN